jgi:CRP/FNR family transcriptional regulator, cAMP and macrophage regulator
MGTMRLFREITHALPPSSNAVNERIQLAAWVARCVGRGATAPLRSEDVSALATLLSVHEIPPGGTVFRAGDPASGVWIVREGIQELSVGTGRRRAVVHLLRSGDVDGDIQLLLGMPMAYTGRALTPTTVLFFSKDDFENLLATHPSIARRWLSSVAQRLASSQARILGLLGRSLTVQAAKLLADEAVDGRVALPQHTLAAMLGVQRPSLNKVLKEFERDGLIRVGYAMIDILNPTKLARLG